MDWVKSLNDFCLTTGSAHNLIPLDPHELLNATIDNTGLVDFGDGDWKPGYCDFVKIFSESDMLHPMGRLIKRIEILKSLQKRLLLTKNIKFNPDILAEEIHEPLFIVGNPRTGTSILFELLAQDTRFRCPLDFEIRYPVDLSKNLDEEKNHRIDSAEKDVLFHTIINPEMKSMHEVNYNLPTECNIIMGLSFTYTFKFDGGSISWINKKNISDAYMRHKNTLQLLQHAGERKNWLLKSPFHIHSLDRLLAQYPDAKILFTHRDPEKSMLSLLTLYQSHARTLSDYKIDNPHPELTFWSEGLKKAIAERNSGMFSDKQVYDIHFLDLMRDPIGSIRKIYDYFGFEFSHLFEAKIAKYLEDKPRYKYGKYSYSPSRFGLNHDDIRDLFSDYIDYFGIYLED